MHYGVTSKTDGEFTANATILLIDDDPGIEHTLRRALGDRGCHVESAGTAGEARAVLSDLRPDLIVLDLALPDADGLLLTSRLRASTDAAILIYSARHRQVDRVLGLKLGATDFVAKPFDLEELEARIEAILRRMMRRKESTSAAAEKICIGDLVIAPRCATVTIANRVVHLRPTEFRLLTVLASQPRTIFDRPSLVQRVWGYLDAGCDHLVDVHIGRLHAKLWAVHQGVSYLETVRGRGFRFLGDDDRWPDLRPGQLASRAET
jgi:DNA-binding response OmpR family regulator